MTLGACRLCMEEITSRTECLIGSRITLSPTSDGEMRRVGRGGEESPPNQSCQVEQIINVNNLHEQRDHKLLTAASSSAFEGGYKSQISYWLDGVSSDQRGKGHSQEGHSLRENQAESVGYRCDQIHLVSSVKVIVTRSRLHHLVVSIDMEI